MSAEGFTEINADLHIHSPASMAVSHDMNFESLAANARLKGLHVLGSGDCLVESWKKELERVLVEVEDGTFEHKESGTRFILTTEIEDAERVHHLIFLPGLDSAKALGDRLSSFSSTDVRNDGRPRVRLHAEAIANMVFDCGGEIGPAHAFTPWTSIYKSYPSKSGLRECYRSAAARIAFLELGLSADTLIADSLSELSEITFLSNSDAHSPYPHRLGREFNRMRVKKAAYGEIMKAIRRDSGRRVTLNVGLDPREGKYHCTACSGCHQKYSLNEARHYDFKCVKCGKIIKIGVKDLIAARLADQQSKSPAHRPPYVHIFPLAEIVRAALGVSSPLNREVQEAWEKLVTSLGSEISILLDVPIQKVSALNRAVGTALERCRSGNVILIPGGGGKYGELIIPESEEEGLKIMERRRFEIEGVSGISQKTLSEF